MIRGSYTNITGAPASTPGVRAWLVKVSRHAPHSGAQTMCGRVLP
jgi:hypothetical protein